MKQCSICDQLKDLDSFGKDRSRKDGHTHRCRGCDRERGRRYDTANKDKRKAYQQANREKTRGYGKRYYYANQEKEQERGRKYREENRDKVNAKARENSRKYREKNPEKIAAAKAKWQRDNPDKCREAHHRRRARKGYVVPQRWRKDESVSMDQCYWCGSEDVADMDHIMPISLGGPAEPYNEAMTCISCNRKKCNMHPLAWVASLFEL